MARDYKHSQRYHDSLKGLEALGKKLKTTTSPSFGRCEKSIHAPIYWFPAHPEESKTMLSWYSWHILQQPTEERLPQNKKVQGSSHSFPTLREM